MRLPREVAWQFQAMDFDVATQSGVFVLHSDDTLVPMRPMQFSAELDFQALISRFSALLVGDQINPDNPRRFVLVKQEQSVGHDIDSSRWSVDHLFLDQDGIPTLVEVKRQTDTRLRREVIGQILEYAANCQSSWSVEVLQANFDATCAALGSPSETMLSELIGPESSIETFWSNVRINLQTGKIRMLIVADQISTEVRRIVELLNEQMSPAEILAIEIRQFAGAGNLRTLAPMVFGQTQEASKKRSNSVVGARWTGPRLLETITSKFPEAEANVAKDIYAWLSSCGAPLVFGVGRENGSVYPLLRPRGTTINPVYLSTEGKIWLQFAPLVGKPIFDDVSVRAEMRDRFAEVASANLESAKLTGYSTLPFSTIAADPKGIGKVVSAWQWIVDKVKAAS